MYDTGYYATGYYQTGYYMRGVAEALLGRTWYSLLFEARLQLSDTTEGCYRYPDSMLLNALNRGLDDLERIRPDAFSENGKPPEITEVIWTAPVEQYIEIQFYDPLMWYVVGWCEMSEDAYAQTGVAGRHVDRFKIHVLRV